MIHVATRLVAPVASSKRDSIDYEIDATLCEKHYLTVNLVILDAEICDVDQQRTPPEFYLLPEMCGGLRLAYSGTGCPLAKR